MSIIERLPTMNDQDLATLRANAERLAQSGTAKQQADAGRLLPLILAELDTRRQAKPAKPARIRRAVR